MNVRQAMVATSALGALLSGATPVAAAPAPPPPPPHGVTAVGQTVEEESLRPLIDLAAQRLVLADKVAAAKYGTDQPIDDPAREREVLDEVRALAVRQGVDPADAERFFADQIEANKVVQRGLYQRWNAHPEQRPHQRPDLGTEVRPQLDRITGEAVRELKDTARVRDENSACHIQLAAAAAAAEVGHHLDALHREALHGAVKSVCS